MLPKLGIIITFKSLKISLILEISLLSPNILTNGKKDLFIELIKLVFSFNFLFIEPQRFINDDSVKNSPIKNFEFSN